MISPPIALVVLGGVILTPLFGAACAWIAQRRYRRLMGLSGKKPYSAIVAPPIDNDLRGALMAGGCLGLPGPLTIPAVPSQEPAVWQALLRWLAVIGIGYAMVSAVRLAIAGMPPEPNFALGDGVVASFSGKPGVVGSPRGDDPLDAREF